MKYVAGNIPFESSFRILIAANGLPEGAELYAVRDFAERMQREEQP